MMALRFGRFVFDGERRQLTRDGAALRVSPKALELLQILLDRRPNVVDKQVLIEKLWPTVSVEEANVRNLIAELRQALGDDDRSPSLIRTVHRIGYAFVSPVAFVHRRGAPRLSAPMCSYALAEGVNLIGRDHDCNVPLDLSGISRRHAEIHVSDDSITLRDLGSKNGTWLNDSRVGGDVELRDGDKLRFGPMTLMLRCASAGDPTDTM